MFFLAVWDTNENRARDLVERISAFETTFREAIVLPHKLCQQQIAVCAAIFISFQELNEDVIETARLARLYNEEAFIILITDKDADLTRFLRPTIRPSGVLFYPLNNRQLRDLLNELVYELNRLGESASEGTFSIKIKTDHYRVFLNDILFFESIRKKVCLRTCGQEISFYDSLDNISKKLPNRFARCHRSFIVNLDKIESVHFADMTIKLKDGCRIPLSRTYRNSIQQILEA